MVWTARYQGIDNSLLQEMDSLAYARSKLENIEGRVA
ncbi:hypothetical protein CLV32_0812 [Pedobacter duraquae]|uniref:Uncharacterized protein n=1 Tax=Pedobacter duraquae TaxID=425511 RepID=A0A4R6IQF4_9SPHI|nr:hypothetical protein CLV32_0812 [Pedobacter duraquae]